MISYRKKGLLYSEAWFDEEPDGSADIVTLRQRRTPAQGRENKPFHTLLVDLTMQPEGIFAAIGKRTRYEIRRAEKGDGVMAEYLTQTAPLLESFIAFYDAFAQEKGLHVLDSFYVQQISKAGQLVLSRIVREDETLVWHAYYCAMGRTRLLYSASFFRGMDSSQRTMIGRVNRYLHWSDMLSFKEAGFHTYDFGGWTPPESGDAEKVRINQFKESFGGYHVTEFNCIYAASLAGRLAFAAKKMLGR